MSKSRLINIPQHYYNRLDFHFPIKKFRAVELFDPLRQRILNLTDLLAS